MLTTAGVRLEKLLEERIDRDDTNRSVPGPQRAAARGTRRMVAVPIANDEEIIRCVAEVREKGFADFVLIGDKAAIKRSADRCGISIDCAYFISADEEATACNLAARLASGGEVDMLMKGHVQTAGFIRAILDQGKGLLDEGQLISHVAVLDIPAYHKLLLVTDAAINVVPNLEQKLTIIANAVRTARSIGIRRPKVACIAPSEKPSPHIQSTVDAAEIRRLFAAGRLRDRLGDVEIDGPFALDVAVSREAALIKEIESPVAGDADILLMPNLDSGNALYKSLTHFADAHVAGIVAGARVPIVLTSRSDSERNKYCAVLLGLAGAGVAPSDHT